MLSKSRIEAFSDGIIAILITIMAFDLKMSESLDGNHWASIFDIIPKLLAYALSFLVIAIMWLNLHVLMDKLPHTTPKMIWFFMLLLFSMSLIPMSTSFLAQHSILPQSIATYGFIMALSAFSFYLLRWYVESKAKVSSPNIHIQKANLISTVLYLSSIPLAWVSPYLSFAVFLGIPIWYFLPKHQPENNFL